MRTNSMAKNRPTKPYDWADDPETYPLSERVIDMPPSMPLPVETVIEATLGHAPEITGRT